MTQQSRARLPKIKKMRYFYFSIERDVCTTRPNTTRQNILAVMGPEQIYEGYPKYNQSHIIFLNTHNAEIIRSPKKTFERFLRQKPSFTS